MHIKFISVILLINVVNIVKDGGLALASDASKTKVAAFKASICSIVKRSANGQDLRKYCDSDSLSHPAVDYLFEYVARWFGVCQ
jgi:hypothetical protein